MIALITALLIAAFTPDAARSTAICEVGRVALRDLPGINHNLGFDTYYAGVSRYHHDLLAACPALVADLPAGYPLVDDDARSRANLGAPIPGKQTRKAFIYYIGVPEFGADLKTAVVHMGYFCTGLCGANFEARYIRTAGKWQRRGEIRNLYVS